MYADVSEQIPIAGPVSFRRGRHDVPAFASSPHLKQYAARHGFAIRVVGGDRIELLSGQRIAAYINEFSIAATGDAGPLAAVYKEYRRSSAHGS